METLTLPARIIGLLKRLKDQRGLLSLTLGGQPEEFLTAIIEINPGDNVMVLDELKPGHGHERLLQLRQLHASAHVDGVSLNFDARLLGSGEKDGAIYYRIALPTALHYIQRRASHRVQLSAAANSKVETTLKGLTIPPGLLTDISTGGIGARYSRNLPSELKNGDVVQCVFPLPGLPGQPFACEAIIRMIRHAAETHSPARLGLEFQNLTKPQLRLLEKCIMDLQREAAKRRQDDD